MKKMLVVALIVVAGLFIMSTPNVMAQEPCESDFTCDGDVDAEDVETFLEDFGRSQFFNPCPDCYDSQCPCTTQGGCPYGMVDCGDRCIDPMIDEDACGADINCLGGTACGAGEICAGGVCTLNCPPGLTECAGTCVDTTTDESNCGDCGTPCDSSEVCLAGNCELFCSANYAPIPKTGQHTSYQDGDDGDLEKGVTWPNPRFTDNSDGTVTDNQTGLIWLKDANCFGFRNWYEALSDCNGLANGQCGLSDGSSADDWRLPNLRELQSLMDYAYYQPALCNSAGTEQWTHGDPFTNVLTIAWYWSSTTLTDGADYAWHVNMYDGVVSVLNKSSTSPVVWPVRGGHLSAVGNNGEICTANVDCLSGNCTDNVCCDTLCGGTCEACVAVYTGGSEGLCLPILPGDDPQAECPPPQTCDGFGNCL